MSSAPKKPGRPRATVDYGLVERLASIGCTLEDIAAATGASKSTLIRLEKTKAFREAIERGRGKGRASLRKMQWQSAEGIWETVEATKTKPARRKLLVAPNVTAQIWLGKQLLGQRTLPDAPRETTDKVKYEWVPLLPEELPMPLSPVKENSTSDPPNLKASAAQSDPASRCH